MKESEEKCRLEKNNAFKEKKFLLRCKIQWVLLNFQIQDYIIDT